MYLIKTRGPRTLALCLTAAAGLTLAIFCRLVSKTHSCMQTNSIEIWVNAHTVPDCACINFRSYLTPYLSWSLKVVLQFSLSMILWSWNFITEFLLESGIWHRVSEKLMFHGRVKCDGVTGLPIYGFLLMFNSNGLTQLLYEI